MEQKAEDLIYFQSVHLVTPDVAKKRGIVVEKPVFISPRLRNLPDCPECGVPDRPLQFEIGRTLRAPHFHFENGGIDCYCASSPDDFRSQINSRLFNGAYQRPGWLAFLRPTGEVQFDDLFNNIARLKQAQVLTIAALCFNENRPLYDGQLFMDDESQSLHPVCPAFDACNLGSYRYSRPTEYYFTQEDNQIVITTKNQ